MMLGKTMCLNNILRFSDLWNHISVRFTEELKIELPDTQILYLMPFMIDSVKEKLPFHKTLGEFRKVLKNIALENDAKVLDMQVIFNEVQKTIEPSELAIDGIHPTNLGHKVMADAIEKILAF